MKSKIATYDVRCITKKACGHDSVVDDISETVKAKAAYAALGKVEKEVLKFPRWTSETIRYTITAGRTPSDQTEAIRPACTKTMILHPKPRCVDFVGKIRYSHDWEDADMFVLGNETVTMYRCITCGMQESIHTWGAKPRNERREYGADPDFLPKMNVDIYGTHRYDVGRHVLNAVMGRIYAILKKTAQNDPSRKGRMCKDEYWIDLTPGFRLEPGKSATVILTGKRGGPIPITIDGVTNVGNDSRYCSECGWQKRIGHDESRHVCENRLVPTPKSSISLPECTSCYGYFSYCCECGERLTTCLGCEHNSGGVWSDYGRFCKDCRDRLYLT